MDILPRYIHQVNPKLKHTYLSFDDEGTLIIRSPKLTKTEIERILIKKSKWITRARQRLAHKKGCLDTFDETTKIYYLGQAYPLILRQHTKQRDLLDFDLQHFTLHYHHYDKNTFVKRFNAFYRKELQAIIPPLVETWAERMGVHPAAITFRKTKRQWGSCSSSNRLSFNTMLAKVPLEAIEYVVIHELAHIRHKHHQKAFWQLVAAHLPDYKERIAILKTYTP